jgi:hypothetical protein
MGYLSFFLLLSPLFYHHAFLSMSFISFCIAHILLITLERVVMRQHGVLFVGGWMKCLLSSSVEA